MPRDDHSPPDDRNASSTDVGFVQQGQVDWVAFGRPVVPLSIDILARFQAAGVQEITYTGIMQLTTRFKLPDLGRKRVWDTVGRLRVYGGASDLLYFGFGHRSFLRFLSESVSELKCIALCSCLAEMHSDYVAGKILSALWHEFGYPEDNEPSHHQFKALIKACGGAFACSPFPELASRMFCPSSRQLAKMHCSDPAQVAQALHGLFDISMGTRTSIQILGGPECSFIAAAAHWIFCLSVHVEDYKGTQVFSSSIATDMQRTSSQVHVQYMDDIQLPKILISHSTFILSDPKELLTYVPEDSLLCLRRRVSWDRCLSYTFGQTFRDLCSRPTTLAHVLGGAARIYLALANGEADVGGIDRTDFQEFAEASFGQGFVNYVDDLFAELSQLDLRRKMEAIVPKRFKQAFALLEESILSLQRSCICVDCSSSKFESSEKQSHFCLVALSATIVELVTIISAVYFESDHKLHPTPEGLTLIYRRNKENVLKKNSPYNLLHVSKEGFVDTQVSRSANRLDDLMKIFTGHGIYEFSSNAWDLFKTRTAISQNGIWLFIEGLVSLTARAERLRRIHVMPGHISRAPRSSLRDATPRQYDSVCDIPSHRVSSMNMPVQAKLETLQLLEGIHDVACNMDSLPSKSDIVATVVEPGGVGELALYYQIKLPSGSVTLLPGELTYTVLQCTGLIPCNERRGGECPAAAKGPEQVFTVESGWTLGGTQARELTNTVCCIWENLSIHADAARVAALALQGVVMPVEGGTNHVVLLRRKECLECCIRACDERSAESSAKLLSGHFEVLKHVFHLI